MPSNTTCATIPTNNEAPLIARSAYTESLDMAEF